MVEPALGDGAQSWRGGNSGVALNEQRDESGGVHSSQAKIKVVV